MGWPKGKLRGPRKKPDESTPVPIQGTNVPTQGTPVAIQETPKVHTIHTTRKRVEDIASATMGYRCYLNGASDKMYWSDVEADDESDMPCGVFFATPLEALKAKLEAVDFLVEPETNEVVLMVIR